MLCAVVCLARIASAETPIPAPTRDLGLKEFLRLVLERNESLQTRALELKIADKRFRAERGAFEPDLVLGFDRAENDRENNAQQQRATGELIFQEKNNVYTSGLEALVPTGARVQLGYTLNDLRNNLQEPVLGTIYTNRLWPEYQAFAGISITQPLLKNAWFPATLANIRVAALAGEVAYQEYRRQMMLVMTTAEAAYWNLHLAQEQVRFFGESVHLAEGLVHDSQARLEAGPGSELEVAEARAGASLRKTKLVEAEQKLFESVAQMLTLISQPGSDRAPLLRATDAPGEPGPAPSYIESATNALQMNPDYLGQTKKLQQENIRLAYAKNQRLPQLDLKASYGLNGLGTDPWSSWQDVEHGGFPSFSAGVELRVPLAGGIRAKNELAAARLRKQQALLSLHEIESQVLNSITASLWRIRSYRESIRDYEQIVAFSRDRLATEMKRLEVGKVGAQRVLDADAALLEAQNAVLETRVRVERARLELELAEGTVLRARNLELSPSAVRTRTFQLLRDAGVPPEQYRELLNRRPPASVEPAKSPDARVTSSSETGRE